MPLATIQRATQKGKRLQAVWDQSGRTRKKAFGFPGTRGVGEGEKKKKFFARHKSAAEALRSGQLGAYLAAKDWNRKGGFKPGDKVQIPSSLT